MAKTFPLNVNVERRLIVAMTSVLARYTVDEAGDAFLCDNEHWSLAGDILDMLIPRIPEEGLTPLLTSRCFSKAPDQFRLSADPLAEPFSLSAVTGPDVWRTPASAGGRNDFHSPIYATPIALNSFKSVKVAISGDFKTTDIAGNKGLEKLPGIWTKAGIELVDDQFFASVTAGRPYSDWSLVKLDQNRATFKMEKSKGSLWIYVAGSNVK
ncbi:unnamed protein product [Fusarium graminearum]|uniref:Uncharacterized protein n=1 Tax=Gibberella zeae TaxID=5518 RepID=A0A4E9EKR2_GIBZA|nr:unnamed protein product [Fusarium graminearum]